MGGGGGGRYKTQWSAIVNTLFEPQKEQTPLIPSFSGVNDGVREKGKRKK